MATVTLDRDVATVTLTTAEVRTVDRQARRREMTPVALMEDALTGLIREWAMQHADLIAARVMPLASTDALEQAARDAGLEE